jgi:hypothetical protein
MWTHFPDIQYMCRIIHTKQRKKFHLTMRVYLQFRNKITCLLLSLWTESTHFWIKHFTFMGTSSKDHYTGHSFLSCRTSSIQPQLS